MVIYFVLKGISDIPGLQAPIFLLILLIYLITLGGNLTVLLLVCLDPQLYTPMYFFLGNLSLMDMTSITITLHRVFVTFISGDNTISFFACMAQIFIFLSVTGDEMVLLTAMSYDRYVAICNPLHYHKVMSHGVCTVLIFFCWVFGFLETIPHLSLLLGLSCYRSNVVNHFYCDLVPVMKLSCSDTSTLEILMLLDGLISGFTPFLLTFTPYIFIITTILKIRSSTGQRKAFYTCSSHITVVVLLYVTLFSLYLRPTSVDNLESNKLLSFLNTVTVPLLNPLIYSLKNQDVKSALRRQMGYCKVML
ncbi:olfactory receptor 8D1-like [Discoglossus pictus]